MTKRIFRKSLIGRRIGLGPMGEIVSNQEEGQMLWGYTAQGTLTNAQLLAMNTTPVEMLAAPGAGLAWIPYLLLMTKEAGTAYTIGSSDNLQVYYGTRTSDNVFEQEDTDWLDQATEESRVVFPQSHTTVGSDIAPLVNTAVNARTGAADWTGGTGDVHWRMWAHLVELPLSF